MPLPEHLRQTSGAGSSDWGTAISDGINQFVGNVGKIIGTVQETRQQIKQQTRPQVYTIDPASGNVIESAPANSVKSDKTKTILYIGGAVLIGVLAFKLLKKRR